VGSPTKYALERGAKAASLPEVRESTEELRFGLLCSGYFCSEKYQLSGKGLIPIVGGFYPDKPNTVKLFSKKRPYKHLIWLKSFSDPQDSDVIVKFNLERFERVIKAEVVSVYSRRPLYEAQCKGCGPKGIGAAVYDAFKPGTQLYQAVVAEREAHLKRLEAQAGLSREDVEAIAKAVSGAQAQKKEEAPSVSSDVDKPQYSAAENPDNFALVIGIQRYSDLPEAQFAERDAEAVKEHLLALGFPRRNIILLTGEKAGRAGIEKYLERWLPRNLSENSRLFFYFSGHGAPDAKSGEAYLVPWDGDPNFLETTGYSIKRLYQMLGTLKAKEVIVAMDACFSGAGGRSVLAKGVRPLVTKIESLAPEGGNILSFSASAASEISGTVEDQGHGAFTYYFLKGLSGAAQDPSGRVTVKALYDYLLPKVQDEARRQNRDQTPQLMPASLGEMAGLILR